MPEKTTPIIPNTLSSEKFEERFLEYTLTP